MNVFLAVVALTLIVSTVVGYIKGFIRTVFSMVALLVIIILTALLSPYVKTYIEKNTGIPSKVSQRISENVDFEEKMDFTNDWKITDYIEKLQLPEQLSDVLVEKSREAGDAINVGSEKAAEEMAESVLDRMTDIVISAIAYLFTFIVLSIVVVVAELLLGIVSKLPVIRKLNKLLGLLLGFFRGYLIISVLYVAVTALGATGFGSEMLEQVASSRLLTFIYGNNPIVDFIMKMF